MSLKSFRTYSVPKPRKWWQKLLHIPPEFEHKSRESLSLYGIGCAVVQQGEKTRLEVKCPEGGTVNFDVLLLGTDKDGFDVEITEKDGQAHKIHLDGSYQSIRLNAMYVTDHIPMADIDIYPI